MLLLSLLLFSLCRLSFLGFSSTGGGDSNEEEEEEEELELAIPVKKQDDFFGDFCTIKLYIY